MKASTASRHPTQASSLTLRDHGKGWAGGRATAGREVETKPGHKHLPSGHDHLLQP